MQSRISVILISITVTPALLATPVLSAEPDKAVLGSVPATPSPVILDVVINSQPAGPALLIQRNGDILVLETDLEAWRLKGTGITPEVIDGQNFVPLTGLTGLSYKINSQTQTLDVSAPAALFEPVAIDANQFEFRDTTEAAFGAFLNYNVIAQGGNSRDYAAAFMEAGVSDDWGLFTNTFMLGEAGISDNVTRYDSTYIWDNPAEPSRLILGDNISRGDIIARSIRYAGIGYGTEYGLQPNLVTFPTPFFNGETALPSSLQVYVNGVLNYTRNVDQGPFSINRIPVVTGGGDLRFVLRDALGVERVYDMPYYVGSNNLRKGLSDYGFNTGFERLSYGLRSFDYGKPFASGNYRRGLTDSITVGTYAEAMSDVRMGSGNLSWLIPNIGEFGLTGAASRATGQSGHLAGISYRRTEFIWNFYLNYQRASRNFSQIGTRGAVDRIREQYQAITGVSLGRFGSVNASYAYLKQGDGSRTDVSSLNYSQQIGDRAQLSAYVISSDTNLSKRSTLIGVGVTIPFGDRGSVDSRVENQDGRLNGTLDVRQSPPPERGIGYGVNVSRGRQNYGNAQLTWRSDLSNVTAQVERRFGQTTGQIQANGSVGYVGGEIFAARQIDDAYGLVVLRDYPNVIIYQDNRPVTRTNTAGLAIVPGLNSYQENRLSIDATTLPIDAQVRGGSITVVPRFRSAVVADYPVTLVRSGSVTIVRPDGKPISVGAEIILGDTGQKTFSGYRGEVFVEGIAEGLVLKVQDGDSKCKALIGKLPPGDVLPQLPEITCTP